MDYLERDSYFCGTNYGKVDLHWLINNLTSHLCWTASSTSRSIAGRLYTFDDFLISQTPYAFNGVLSITRASFLKRCSIVICHLQTVVLHLPADINEYTKYNDYKLYEHLASVKNPWAQRIAQRRPYRMLIELHSTNESYTAPTTFAIRSKTRESMRFGRAQKHVFRSTIRSRRRIAIYRFSWSINTISGINRPRSTRPLKYLKSMRKPESSTAFTWLQKSSKKQKKSCRKSVSKTCRLPFRSS